MAVFEDPVDHWSKAIKVPAWPGNRVTPLIDGEATFKMMYNAIRSALRERDNWGCYIYLLGWYLDLDLPLVENKPETSFFALLQKAAASHVQTRVMLWTGTPWPPNSGIPESEGRSLIGLLSTRKNNRNARDRINSLEYAAAIVDSENLAITGSHHQKVLIVKGHEGLKAFCGGIDINADRVKAVRGQPGSAMHDVHCMIEGDAAHILVDIFVQRWLAHPGHFYFDEADTRPAKNRKKRGGPLLGLTDRKPPAPGQRPVGAQYVGIGRTFNCFFPGSSVGPVGPQPCGDRTIHDMIAGVVKMVGGETQHS